MSEKNFGKIYLASPYNHELDHVRATRAGKVVEAAAKLITAGFNVFSPIAHSHWIGDYVRQYPNWGSVGPISHSDWMKIDLDQLKNSRLLVVLQLRGWKKSKGVQEEMQYARDYDIPIVYLHHSQVDNKWLQFYIEWQLVNGLRWCTGSRKETAWKDYMSSGIDFSHLYDEHGNKTSVATKYEPNIGVETPEEKEALDSVPVHDLCVESALDSSISAKDLHKGIKAIEAKNKPTILNYPWDSFVKPFGPTMAHLVKATIEKNYNEMRSRVDCLEEQLKNRAQVPPLDYLKVNDVFNTGAKKHGARTFLNYNKSDIVLLVEAIGRHLLKGVNNIDEESGQLHRYHVLANVMMIRTILNKGE